MGLADRFSTWKKVDKYIQAVKGWIKVAENGVRVDTLFPDFVIGSSGYRSPGSIKLGVAYHAFVCHRVAITLVYFNVHSFLKTVTG